MGNLEDVPPLTVEELNRVMDEIIEAHKDDPPWDPSMLSTEERKMWESRGVMAVDSTIWFTDESKKRVERAMADNDFTALNPWELAALHLLRWVEEATDEQV